MGRNLLSLPTEILTQIFEEVLSLAELPPAKFSGSRPVNPAAYVTSTKTPGHTSICIGREEPVANGTVHWDLLLFLRSVSAFTPSVFCVNRQLCSLGRDLNLQGSRRKWASLDLAIVGERKYVATWLSIPADWFAPVKKPNKAGVVGHHMDGMVCSMRGTGVFDRNEPALTSGGTFMGGAGGPQTATWSMLEVLHRVVRYGPRMVSRETDTLGSLHNVDESTDDVGMEFRWIVGPDTKVIEEPGGFIMTPENSWRFDTLMLDFPTPSAPESLSLGAAQSDRFINWRRIDGEKVNNGHDDDQSDIVLDPEYLRDFVQDHLERLLEMEGYYAEYGDVLYQCFSEIVLRVDGKEIVRFDLAARLREWELARQASDKAINPAERAKMAWLQHVILLRKHLGFNEPYDSLQGLTENHSGVYKSYKACKEEAT